MQYFHRMLKVELRLGIVAGIIRFEMIITAGFTVLFPQRIEMGGLALGAFAITPAGSAIGGGAVVIRILFPRRTVFLQICCVHFPVLQAGFVLKCIQRH